MKDEIKEIFQSKLHNHESAVDPAVWQGVQQQMGLSSSSSAASASKGFLATTTTKIVATVAVVAAVGTASYFSFREDPKAPSQQLSVNQVQTQEPTEEQSNAQTVEFESNETNEAFNNQNLEVNNTQQQPAKPEEIQHTVNDAEIERGVASESASSQDVRADETTNESSIAEHSDLGSSVVLGPPNTTEQPKNNQNQTEKANKTTDQVTETVLPATTESSKPAVLGVVISDIPKVFTPNNDGKNDVFPITVEHAQKVDFIVLNTNSQVVYKSESFDIQWNGLDLNGEEVEAGNYIYILKVVGLNNQVVPKKGLITVIK